MDDHDNPLAGYDLSAWDAPPPPAGLADAVVSRARARHSQTVTSEPRSWKKPAFIIGGLVAAAAIALFFVFGMERAPVDGRGDVQAAVPQRLDVGSTSAMIEAGGELGWRRHGAQVEVTQRRGAVTWNVGANDTLVLQSGDSGAMGASIEAAGASLRVEVQVLNRTDARALGVGSVVAAAVSIVTVVVYEGHVKATHEGTTVTIAPGATAQFPAKIDAPTPDSQFAVGGGPIDPKARGNYHATFAEQAILNYRVMGGSESCIAGDIDREALAAFDRGEIETAKKKLVDAYNCENDPNVARKLVVIACAMNDKAQADFWGDKAGPPDDQRALTQLREVCARRGIDLAVFVPDTVTLDEKADALRKKLEAASEAVEKASPPGNKTIKDSGLCDAARSKAKGEEYFSEGMDMAALAQFESSLRCKEDPFVIKLAFMAACRAKSQTKAQLYFSKLPEASKAGLQQICVRAGVSVK